MKGKVIESYRNDAKPITIYLGEKLARVYDVLSDILMNQPAGSNIELIFEKEEHRRRVIINGDKLYILSSYDKSNTKLSIDGTIVRDDITTIPKRGFLSDIENILFKQSLIVWIQRI